MSGFLNVSYLEMLFSIIRQRVLLQKMDSLDDLSYVFITLHSNWILIVCQANLNKKNNTLSVLLAEAVFTTDMILKNQN